MSHLSTQSTTPTMSSPASNTIPAHPTSHSQQQQQHLLRFQQQQQLISPSSAAAHTRWQKDVMMSGASSISSARVAPPPPTNFMPRPRMQPPPLVSTLNYPHQHRLFSPEMLQNVQRPPYIDVPTLQMQIDKNNNFLTQTFSNGQRWLAPGDFPTSASRQQNYPILHAPVPLRVAGAPSSSSLPANKPPPPIIVSSSSSLQGADSAVIIQELLRQISALQQQQQQQQQQPANHNNNITQPIRPAGPAMQVVLVDRDTYNQHKIAAARASSSSSYLQQLPPPASLPSSSLLSNETIERLQAALTASNNNNNNFRATPTGQISSNIGYASEPIEQQTFTSGDGNFPAAAETASFYTPPKALKYGDLIRLTQPTSVQPQSRLIKSNINPPTEQNSNVIVKQRNLLAAADAAPAAASHYHPQQSNSSHEATSSPRTVIDGMTFENANQIQQYLIFRQQQQQAAKAAQKLQKHRPIPKTSGDQFAEKIQTVAGSSPSYSGGNTRIPRKFDVGSEEQRDEQLRQFLAAARGQWQLSTLQQQQQQQQLEVNRNSRPPSVAALHSPQQRQTESTAKMSHDGQLGPLQQLANLQLKLSPKNDDDRQKSKKPAPIQPPPTYSASLPCNLSNSSRSSSITNVEPANLLLPSSSSAPPVQPHPILSNMLKSADNMQASQALYRRLYDSTHAAASISDSEKGHICATSHACDRTSTNSMLNEKLQRSITDQLQHENQVAASSTSSQRSCSHDSDVQLLSHESVSNLKLNKSSQLPAAVPPPRGNNLRTATVFLNDIKLPSTSAGEAENGANKTSTAALSEQQKSLTLLLNACKSAPSVPAVRSAHAADSVEEVASSSDSTTRTPASCIIKSTTTCPSATHVGELLASCTRRVLQPQVILSSLRAASDQQRRTKNSAQKHGSTAFDINYSTFTTDLPSSRLWSIQNSQQQQDELSVQQATGSMQTPPPSAPAQPKNRDDSQNKSETICTDEIITLDSATNVLPLTLKRSAPSSLVDDDLPMDLSLNNNNNNNKRTRSASGEDKDVGDSSNSVRRIVKSPLDFRMPAVATQNSLTASQDDDSKKLQIFDSSFSLANSKYFDSNENNGSNDEKFVDECKLQNETKQFSASSPSDAGCKNRPQMITRSTNTILQFSPSLRLKNRNSGQFCSDVGTQTCDFDDEHNIIQNILDNSNPHASTTNELSENNKRLVENGPEMLPANVVKSRAVSLQRQLARADLKPRIRRPRSALAQVPPTPLRSNNTTNNDDINVSLKWPTTTNFFGNKIIIPQQITAEILTSSSTEQTPAKPTPKQFATAKHKSKVGVKKNFFYSRSELLAKSKTLRRNRKTQHQITLNDAKSDNTSSGARNLYSPISPATGETFPNVAEASKDDKSNKIHNSEQQSAKDQCTKSASVSTSPAPQQPQAPAAAAELPDLSEFEGENPRWSYSLQELIPHASRTVYALLDNSTMLLYYKQSGPENTSRRNNPYRKHRCIGCDVKFIDRQCLAIHQKRAAFSLTFDCPCCPPELALYNFVNECELHQHVVKHLLKRETNILGLDCSRFRWA